MQIIFILLLIAFVVVGICYIKQKSKAAKNLEKAQYWFDKYRYEKDKQIKTTKEVKILLSQLKLLNCKIKNKPIKNDLLKEKGD